MNFRKPEDQNSNIKNYKERNVNFIKFEDQNLKIINTET